MTKNIKLNQWKRFLPLFLLCVFLFPNTVFAKESAKEKVTTTDPKVKITAQSAIVMDLSTGAILYGKNINKKMYPASITKIMTALLALEHASLSEVVTFSHDSVYNIVTDSSRLWVAEGEKFTMENCLYGMMLASANDLAYAISEQVAGTYSNFITMMNQRATELGCTQTNFTNPHGLFEKEHYTTAYDMALISREAFKNNIFRTIVSTKDYTIPKSNMADSRYIYQHHKMIYNNSYGYEWFAGGKTGYTTDSGNTLVTFAKKEDRMLVCVLLRPADKYVQYKETRTLLDYGFDNYSLVTLYPGTEQDTVSLFPTTFDDTTLWRLTKQTEPVQISLPKDASISDVNAKITPLSSVSDQSPIAKVEYTYKNLIVGTQNIYHSPFPDSFIQDLEQQDDSIPDDSTEKDNEKAKTKPKSYAILTFFLLFLLLGLLYFLYYVLYLLPRRRRRHSYQYRRRHGNQKRR